MKLTRFALAHSSALAWRTSDLPARAAMGLDHGNAKPAVQSHTLTVTANGKSITLSMADLKAMPQRTLRVHNGHNNQDETYTGVGLDDLLAKYGISLANGNARAGKALSYIKARGHR